MKIKTNVKAGKVLPVDPPPTSYPTCGLASDGTGTRCPPPNIIPGPGA
jgi:hypothetical protein